MSDILPCPFCGGEPNEAIESNGGGVFWVICDNVKNNMCGCEGPYRQSEADAIAAWNRRIPQTEVHSDDLAVDRFSAAMKIKLSEKRAQGYHGWDDPYDCSISHLSELLRKHVEKGDPIDVANFCMMLHQRGGSILPASKAKQVEKDQ